MPIGYSNGMQFEDEFAATQFFASKMPVIDLQDYVDRKNRGEAEVSVDWDAEFEKLPPGSGQQPLAPITEVADKVDPFFQKPKAPVVGKPTPDDPSPQQRLESSHSGVRKMESQTIERMMELHEKRKRDSNAGWLHRIADIQGRGSDLHGPYKIEDLTQYDNSLSNFTFDETWEKKDFESFEVLKKLMDNEHLDEEGFIVKHPNEDGPGEIMLRKKVEIPMS